MRWRWYKPRLSPPRRIEYGWEVLSNGSSRVQWKGGVARFRVAGHMRQLRTVSLAVAIVASILALISGAILFFVIEPPFLASIFLACSAIAIICFLIAGAAGYFAP